MEGLTKEFLIDWFRRHCKTKEELDSINRIARKEAIRVLGDKLNGVDITVEPIVFDLREFTNRNAFSKALFIAAKKYSNVDDVIVRYTKPEDEKTHEVLVQFHVLKKQEKKE